MLSVEEILKKSITIKENPGRTLNSMDSKIQTLFAKNMEKL